MVIKPALRIRLAVNYKELLTGNNMLKLFLYEFKFQA